MSAWVPPTPAASAPQLVKNPWGTAFCVGHGARSGATALNVLLGLTKYCTVPVPLGVASAGFRIGERPASPATSTLYGFGTVRSQAATCTSAPLAICGTLPFWFPPSGPGPSRLGSGSVVM